MLVDDLRDVGGEDDFEAHVSDVPTHDVLGMSVKSRTRVKNLRTGAGAGFFAEGCFAAGDDDCGGAVAEEAAGYEVGDGLIVVLPGEGTEFDGEKKRVLVGEGANVVGGTRDAGCSGDATEAEDGSAFDRGRERHEVDEAGIDGGTGDAGDGGEEDG